MQNGQREACMALMSECAVVQLFHPAAAAEHAVGSIYPVVVLFTKTFLSF